MALVMTISNNRTFKSFKQKSSTKIDTLEEIECKYDDYDFCFVKNASNNNRWQFALEDTLF